MIPLVIKTRQEMGPLFILPLFVVCLAASPRKDGGDLLLSQDFLRACGEAYAVFPAGQDNQQRSFNAKYLNIVDPLRPGNNLGRSVNQGTSSGTLCPNWVIFSLLLVNLQFITTYEQNLQTSMREWFVTALHVET